MLISIRIIPFPSKKNQNRTRKFIDLRCDACSKNFTKQSHPKFIKAQYHFCSRKCLNDSQRNGVIKEKKETYFMKKFGKSNPLGVPDIIKNRKITMIERYGVENVSQIDDIKKKKSETMKDIIKNTDIIQRTQTTNLERYGVKSFLSTPQARIALKNWSLQKYGTEHHMLSEEYKQQHVSSFMKTYGVSNPQQVVTIKQKTISTLLEKYGVSNSYLIPYVKDRQIQSIIRNAYLRTSKPEEKFFQLLLERFSHKDIRRSAYVKDPKTNRHWFIDFYVNSIQTYFQVDGIYWHGLNKPYDQLIGTIKQAFDRDRRQDEWAIENMISLIRITDQQIINYYDDLKRMIHSL